MVDRAAAKNKRPPVLVKQCSFRGLVLDFFVMMFGCCDVLWLMVCGVLLCYGLHSR